jgi:CheY-like chemotaxis protein
LTSTTPTHLLDLAPILVIDENQDHLALTAEVLEDASLSNPVCHLASTDEALAHLKDCAAQPTPGHNRLPCLILLSLHLPERSGIEFLRQVKRDPALRTVPVIILTTSEDPHEITTAYRLGADGYLVKPFQFQEFYSAVQQTTRTWAILSDAHDPQAGRSSR